MRFLMLLSSYELIFVCILEIDRCTPNPCQHGSSCQEINGGVGYVCQCPVGYKGQICDSKYNQLTPRRIYATLSLFT